MFSFQRLFWSRNRPNLSTTVRASLKQTLKTGRDGVSVPYPLFPPPAICAIHNSASSVISCRRDFTTAEKSRTAAARAKLLTKKQKLKSATSSKSAVVDSNALHRAAQEADKLARSFPPLIEDSLCDKDMKKGGVSWDEDAVESHKIRHKEAMTAAKALLRIANVKALSNPIQDDDPEKVSKIHKAFIGVLSWGLSLIEQRQSVALLQKLVMVAERAYKLDLPLHIPLYHRLIAQVAAHSSSFESKNPSKLILRLISRVMESYDMEQLSDSDVCLIWVEPVMQQFLFHPNNIENPRLDHVDYFLNQFYKLPAVDENFDILLRFEFAIEVISALRKSVRSALLDPTRHYYADEVTSIMFWLQESMTEGLLDIDEIFGDGWTSRSFTNEFVGKSQKDSLDALDVIVEKILTRDMVGSTDAFSSILRNMIDEKNQSNEELSQVPSSISIPASIPTSRSSQRSSQQPGEELEVQLDEVPLDSDNSTSESFPDVTLQLLSWGGSDETLAYSSQYEAFLNIIYQDEDGSFGHEDF